MATLDGLQLAATDVIADAVPEDDTETTAEPFKLGSCVLVAVIVTLPVVLGAVSTPVDEIEPALADHVTPEL